MPLFANLLVTTWRKQRFLPGLCTYTTVDKSETLKESGFCSLKLRFWLSFCLISCHANQNVYIFKGPKKNDIIYTMNSFLKNTSSDEKKKAYW